MHILAIDTCFGACSAALSWGEGREGTRAPERSIAARFEVMEKGHAEHLIPMIGELFAEAKVPLRKLDLIAVTSGPGTFTGVRIGIAAARALALATGAQCCDTSSLHLMGLTASARLSAQQGEGAPFDIAVAVDARRDQLYVQHFDGATLGPRTEPMLLTAEQAAALLGDVPTLAVGSGGRALAHAAGRAGRRAEALLSDLEPDARYMLDIATRLTPRVARPLYLRPPDAKPQGGTPLAWTP